MLKANSQNQHRVLSALTRVLLPLVIVYSLPVAAQVSVDRAISGFSLLPAGTDASGLPLYDIQASFHVTADGSSSVPIDASTEVEISVAGEVVLVTTIGVQLNPGDFSCVGGPPCNAGCGTGSGNGIAFTLICGKDLPCSGALCFCECRTPSITAAAIAHCSIDDDVCVTLSPATGSAPDTESLNNVSCLVFDGESSFYHRSVESITAVENSTAPGTYDVTISGSAVWNAIPLPAIDLSVEVVLKAGPTILSAIPVNLETEPGVGSCFGQGCGTNCGVVNGLPANCDPTFFLGCACLSGWVAEFPGLTLDPEQVEILEVMLMPSPGALPELPGFPTPERFLRGDCDVSGGPLGISDALVGLQWLFSGGSEPMCLDACDADDTGGVGLTDMLYLLQHLFLSGPAPLPPVGECDVDPTPDNLGCENYPCLR